MIIKKKNLVYGIVGVLFLIVAISIYIDYQAGMFVDKKYTPPFVGVENYSIDNNSYGSWNLNVTVFMMDNVDYVAMEVVWLDSTNNLIEKKIVWNKTKLKEGEVFNISNSYNLTSTPSKVLILFYDNPFATNDGSNSKSVLEIDNNNGIWEQNFH